MKLRFTVRPAFAALLLPFAALGTASAQTASPSPIPPSKPATEVATPSPGAPVNSTTATGEKKTTVRKEVLEKYDTNHNGVLDPDEKAAFEKDRQLRKQENLQKYDTNHDGKLDDSERAAMRADREKERAAKTGKEKPTPTP